MPRWRVSRDRHRIRRIRGSPDILAERRQVVVYVPIRGPARIQKAPAHQARSRTATMAVCSVSPRAGAHPRAAFCCASLATNVPELFLRQARETVRFRSPGSARRSREHCVACIGAGSRRPVRRSGGKLTVNTRTRLGASPARSGSRGLPSRRPAGPGARRCTPSRGRRPAGR